MNQLWWLIALFAVGGFTSIADTVRTALRTRHERKMERLAVRGPAAAHHALRGGDRGPVTP